MGNVKSSGAVGTVVATVADFVLNSGEFVAAILSWIVGNADLLLPLVSTVRGQLAPRIHWLPTDVFDQLVFAFGLLFVLVLVRRLVVRTIG